MRLLRVDAITGEAEITAMSSDIFPKKNDIPFTFEDGKVLNKLNEGSSIFCTDDFSLWMYQKNDTWSNGSTTR